LCTLVIVLIIYCITLIQLVISYRQIQQALQWWFHRESLRLFLESEGIRDSLLQQSFIIRRSLELLPVNERELSIYKIQECLKKIDKLHQCLVQLSERLFPSYPQGNFPLTLQSVLEHWVASHPNIYCDINLPTCWRHESVEYSLIVVHFLEELLRIAVPETLAPISIYIHLKEQNHKAKLIVQITYPNKSTLILHSSHQPEFKILSKSFGFLTSGKCSFFQKNLNMTWYLCW
jgi:hypothetical protein